MEISAWVPGHATLFFAVPQNFDDPQKMGSLGGGFNFSEGVTTFIKRADKNTIFWNDFKINGRVSETAYKIFCQNFEVNQSVEIRHYSNLKIGYGLSTSGAGAIGTTFCLNSLFNTSQNEYELFKIAHQADVENRTGLGSVVGQMTSGIELRTSQGGPLISKIKSFAAEDKIVLLMLDRLKTSSILTSSKKMTQVTKSGLIAVENALTITKDYANLFIQIGRNFTEKCGLLTPQVKKIFHKLNAIGENNFCMAMIGETIVIRPENHKKLLNFANSNKIKNITTKITMKQPFVHKQ